MRRDLAAACAGVTICLLLAWVAPTAAAVASEPDSALDRFLGTLSDSTSGFFGLTAARPDTAGLDSALAHGLAHPEPPDRRRSLSFGPVLAFSRVDGPSYGASAALDQGGGRMRLAGRIAWASGPNDVLGGGTLERTFRRAGASWLLRVDGGRSTGAIDRDSGIDHFAMIAALVSGSDHTHYLRRDGIEAAVARNSHAWRALAAYRDMLERPLTTHAGWNLGHDELAVPLNLAAARGRNREVQLEATVRLPRAPAWLEADYASSSGRLASDFEYRRTRVALAADIAAGRRLAIVPQLEYGRLSGQAIPQASFYIGRDQSVRSLRDMTRGGTGIAMALLDAIGTDDLLALARIPHPAWLPLQGGGFAAAGAVWGPDPLSGSSRGGLDWPDQEHWISEAGLMLLWRPGIPSPTSFLSLSYAWPLGPARESARFSVSYGRALALLNRPGD